jgi:hypothetical protein
MSMNASLHLNAPVGVFPGKVNTSVRRTEFSSRDSAAPETNTPPAPPFLSVLWSYRDIWFTPLACETVLFLCALHLTVILARIMESGGIGLYAWLPIAAGAIAYVTGKVESEREELFMTRFVALAGSGGLMIAAIMVMALITVIAPSLLGAMGRNQRLILMLPFAIFLMRELMLIRSSRFAPSMASLALRHNRPVGVTARLRQILHYWMH